MTLHNLSISLMMRIFAYLNVEDVMSLEAVCKKLRKTIQSPQTQRFFFRETIRIYFPSDVETYCHLGEGIELSNYMNVKRASLMNLEQKVDWKARLKTIGDLKRRWISLLSAENNFSDYDRSKEFFESIINAMKEPPLPMLKLKRENVGVHNKSLFQNFLTDILYEGGKPGFFVDPNTEYIKEIFQMPGVCDEMSKREITSDLRDKILKARWLIYSENDGEVVEQTKELTIESEKIEIEESTSEYFGLEQQPLPFLLQVHNILSEIFTAFADINLNYLLLQKNAFDFLMEYCVRWNVYVCAVAEISKYFEEFEECFNTNYDSVFREFPCHPKYTIWRHMIKIWIARVFDVLEDDIRKSNKIVLKSSRDKNVKILLREIQEQLKDSKIIYSSKVLESVPLNLFLNFYQKILRKKSSYVPPEEFVDYSKTQHDIFSSNMTHIQTLLFNIHQSIFDICLNEITVHFNGHSQLVPDAPFIYMERDFEEETRKFYESHFQVFLENPIYFNDFLLSDYSFFDSILNQRTLNVMKILQKSVLLDFIKLWVRETLEKKDDHLPKEDFYDSNIGKEIAKIIEDMNKDNQEIKSFLDRKPDIELDRAMECLRHRIYKPVVELYWKTVAALEEMENNKPYEDMDIEEINKQRGLPLELDETESLFYCLCQKVSLEVLYEINGNMKTFSNGEGNQEERQESDGESLETYNEDEDQQTLREPSLKSNRKNTGQSSMSSNHKNVAMAEQEEIPSSKKHIFEEPLPMLSLEKRHSEDMHNIKKGYHNKTNFKGCRKIVEEDDDDDLNRKNSTELVFKLPEMSRTLSSNFQYQRKDPHDTNNDSDDNDRQHLSYK